MKNHTDDDLLALELRVRRGEKFPQSKPLTGAETLDLIDDLRRTTQQLDEVMAAPTYCPRCSCPKCRDARS